MSWRRPGIDLWSKTTVLVPLLFTTLLLQEEVEPDTFKLSEGVTYHQVAERKLLCDIYQPESEGLHPGMLVVHGGAWRSGNRRQLRGYCRALAERGFVCFAIDYRLAPKHKFPAQIDDCRAALKWMRQHANDYNLDPARVGAIGYSAGGHLVSLLATTGEPPTEENGNVDTRLTAVVAGGAPTDFRWFPDNGKWAEYWMGGDLTAEPQKFAAASAVPFVDENDSPIFFFNGTGDRLVPLVWTRPLHDALRSKNIDTELFLVQGANHMQAAADEAALKKGYQFLVKHLQAARSSDQPRGASSSLPKIELHETDPQASYRAIGVGRNGTVIVGGSGSRVYRSTNGGKIWAQVTVSDAELDFRDVEQAADGSWTLMSAGSGVASSLFRSTDDGKTWQKVFANEVPTAFFNGLDFWSDGRGMVIGDPLEGKLDLLVTSDNGESWKRITGPEMAEGEYGFAASGTGIVAGPEGRAWIATGAAASRVLMTSDFGQTWSSAETGLRHGTESSGIFSFASSGDRAIVVGGNYLKPNVSDNNCAISSDGGRSWTRVDCDMPHKACVRFLDDKAVIAVGRTGLMKSEDGGVSWTTVSQESFYAFDVNTNTKTIFLAGAEGRIATMDYSTTR